MEFKYKANSLCATCKYFRYRPNIKNALVNECSKFNPRGSLTMKDFHRKYALPFPYVSLMHHCNKHITKLEKHVVGIINEKEPIKKVMGELVVGGPRAHEKSLDAFIAQFDEKIIARELPITVKDGLTAIKIKADIESKNKDIKKDILKMMVGASGESNRPPERAEA